MRPGLTTSVWQWKGLRVDKIEFEGVTFDATDTLPRELAQKAGSRWIRRRYGRVCGGCLPAGAIGTLRCAGCGRAMAVTLIFCGVAAVLRGAGDD